MKRIMIGLITLIPIVSAADTLSPYGIVNKVRVVSSIHPSLSENEAVFTLTPAQPNCNWVKIPPESNSYISTVLFAKAQGTNVRVWYDSDTCKTITIEID